MSFTTRLISQMKYEFKIQDRSGIYGLTQRKMAYNSNKIEGSTLTEKQTASIFETGSLSADGSEFRTKDVEEMTGHFTMFNYMLQTYDLQLTEELIKQYHFKLKAGVFEDIANGYPIGEYKNRRNIISDITTALPAEVPEKVNQLIRDYEAKNNIAIEDIAKFHSDFEKIHPFQDGNGRVGRMLLFKECLRNDLCPVIVQESTKSDYYKALNVSQQSGDHSGLSAYFRKCQEEYQQMAEGFIVPDNGQKRSVEDIVAEANKIARDRETKLMKINVKKENDITH